MRSPRAYSSFMRRKMRRCFSRREVFGFDGAGDLDERGVVGENRPEHEPLGIQIHRQPFLQRNIGSNHKKDRSTVLPLPGSNKQVIGIAVCTRYP